MTYTYRYPRPSVTVDAVVFGVTPQDNQLRVLLVKRKNPPFEGFWALPGGFVNVSDEGDQGEPLEDAVLRELKEETNVAVEYIEQLGTFGAPGRDPRGRVISVAYFGLVRTTDHLPIGGDDAAEAAWFTDPFDPEDLAFDHDEIIHAAKTRLQGKIRYAPIGFNLLPAQFTLPEMRNLYETILQRKIEPANFRRKVQQMKILKEVGVRKREGVGSRPPVLYEFDKKRYDRAVRDGFNFEI